MEGYNGWTEDFDVVSQAFSIKRSCVGVGRGDVNGERRRWTGERWWEGGCKQWSKKKGKAGGGWSR